MSDILDALASLHIQTGGQRSSPDSSPVYFLYKPITSRSQQPLKESCFIYTALDHKRVKYFAETKRKKTGSLRKLALKLQTTKGKKKPQISQI